jgi:hypothetical protein
VTRSCAGDVGRCARELRGEHVGPQCLLPHRSRRRPAADGCERRRPRRELRAHRCRKPGRSRERVPTSLRNGGRVSLLERSRTASWEQLFTAPASAMSVPIRRRCTSLGGQAVKLPRRALRRRSRALGQAAALALAKRGVSVVAADRAADADTGRLAGAGRRSPRGDGGGTVARRRRSARESRGTG